ncbi:MAG: ankyrin repeat domain-containing protein [Planctomycetota bacterium]
MIQFTGKTSDFLKIGVSAAARGDIEAVREILRARPKWIHRIGSHGRTMLWEAAHRGKFEMVKYLVRRKADINAFGTHYTPYFVDISCYCIARHKRHNDVADYLLKKGASQNIHTAAFLGDLPAVKKFLRSSPKRIDACHPQVEVLPAGDPRGDFLPFPSDWATPLVYALRGGPLETVEYLISKKARIRGLEEKLFIAAGDDAAKIRLLIDSGANKKALPDILEDEGPLAEIAKHCGQKMSTSTASEELVYLCRGDRGGNPEEVRKLIKLGANVNHQDHKGKTALHRAAKAGFRTTMEVLVEHEAELESRDLKGETPVFEAVRSTIRSWDKQRAALRYLIQIGANLEHRNAAGQTAREVAQQLKSDISAKIVRTLRS